MQISELKVQEEGRRCEELHSQQLATRLGVDEAHMNELHEFHDVWDRKVAEYEDHARNMVERIRNHRFDFRTCVRGCLCLFRVLPLVFNLFVF